MGFLGVIPIYARGGWFFEDFIGAPSAPNGTVELLIDAGMRAAVAENVPYVTLGLVPLVGDVAPWLRALRRWSRALYDFDGLKAFKAKFKPHRWDPIWLAHPPGVSGWTATLDALAAFSRGGLLDFGVRTLLRGPAIVMRVLAVLLVPWTLLLSLPASTPWFPSESVRWAWVGFDVVVAIALYALSERWNRRLGDVLACAVTLDAALTIVQAIAFNAPRARGVIDVFVIVVAVVAPTFAATLLWSGRAHRNANADDER